MTALSDNPAALPAIVISSRAARRLAGGFMWVYSNEIERRDEQHEPAYWCRFVHEGRTVATGYFNRHSLIAAGRLPAAKSAA